MLIFGLVLFVAGIVLLILSVKNKNEKVTPNVDKVPATITFIKTHRVGSGSNRRVQFTVRISYKYNEQVFNDVEYNSYSSTWKVGDTIEINIDKDTGMFCSDGTLGRKVLKIFGIILTLIGASMCTILLVSEIILRLILKLL